MNITFGAVNDIFKTLPIGYYLGRNIKNTLDESGDLSFFEPAADRIVISYKNVAAALEAATFDADKDSLESVIRGILYHELSHVLLTPADLDKSITYISRTRSMPNAFEIMNIFEDERIETLCARVYMNTDFRRNIMLLNNYTGAPATTADEAFYHLVRFHVGKEEFLNRMFWIIRSYKEIRSCMSYYINAVLDFYRDFCEDWERDHKAPESAGEGASSDKGESKDGSSDTGSDESEDTSGSSTSATAETDDEETESDSSDDCQGTPEPATAETTGTAETTDTAETTGTPSMETSSKPESKTEDTSDDGCLTVDDLRDMCPESPDMDKVALTKDQLKDLAQNKLDKYRDTKLMARLSAIINQKLRKDNQNGKAINSYSGRFNVRAVTREDCRYWMAQNRSGHIRAYSKFHLNLFIDNSGSFCRNDDRMNQFLIALANITDPNFSFDVITINTHVVEWEGHNRLFESDGGNCVRPSIKKVIDRHQRRGEYNYNVVLFDGDAHSDDGWGRNPKYDTEPLMFFDRPDTIIISDRDNERYFEGASKAKVKYVSNYCAEFIDAICNLMERAL